MSIGVCYFPEHWPSERWERDVEQMAEAGIDYVRMAEFSWGRVEPARGEFDFDWLDEAVELVGDHGMEAVLCTPTATPPKWLVDERPGILQADRDGTAREWGSRRFTCFNSPAYREETERVVRAFADRYAADPRVAGWQTDNEFGCHETVRCYCEDCADAFRGWLREKYRTVAALNDAWGTTFWSQQYDSFEAVEPPRPTPAEQHPSRLLDYYRFASDSVAEYNRLHADLLREANDDWFVTHNFMGDFRSLDAHSLSDDLDFLSWDSYPTGFVQDRRQGDPTADELRAGDPDEVGMNHDLYRGAKRKPFWVMEQQPGDVNWPPHAPQPAEGVMRLWAHHAVAHGADAVLYFRWRRCLEGQEQYHAGLRKADGSPDRGYRDATRAADELFDLDPVDAPVAVLHDYENLWATEIQPHSPDWDYWSHLRAYYGAVRRHGVQADLVHPGADLGDYAVVFAPAFHLADDSRAAALRAYVEGGGRVVFGARTGLKDPANKLHDAPAPGPLADLAGATVDQHESLPASLDATVEYGGERYDYRTWAEWLSPDEATAIGTHASGVAEGRPAVTERAVGDGTVTYCGVWPEPPLADALVSDALDAAGVPRTDRLPESVRVAERDGYAWVTNFGSDPVEVSAPAAAEFVVGDESVDGFDVAIVEAPAADLDVS
ncbi:beta-galactosidase [Halorussus sp. MSC15.2]|uniref:beta-galactosidase n=1 Tax=Halorussus sp. MSC15.2 TaxID=2283638 RepID=UPI0013D3DB70|nr:beta-galactosidase [Halorussus sp. MSC15.2]NEU55558.1 beta-galactosidase [Halorussus sp. MSC15.2]